MHKPSLISTTDGRLYIHIHSKRLDLQSLPVMSEEYGLMGKIYIYRLGAKADRKEVSAEEISLCEFFDLFT